MTMHVLVVEDDPEFIDEIRRILVDLQMGTQIVVASSRDTGFISLETNFFDLIILDLKIPTIDGALDADPLHGRAVFSRARSEAPGTPIFVLTGSPAEDFIPEMLGQQQQIDIWGEGREVGTVHFLQKYKLNEFPSLLAPIVDAVTQLSDVELERDKMDLIVEEDRLIRIFARSFRCTKCAVSQLGSGLSGAKVLRLRVTDEHGVLVHDAVAKIGSQADVRDEVRRFNAIVSRLEPGVTPRHLATKEFGAKAKAGVFYGLARGFEATAFDVAQVQTDYLAKCIKSLEGVTKRWIDGVPQTRRSIGEIRRRNLSDEALGAIIGGFDLRWITDFERHQVQVIWGCVHGDLHGSNVLVSTEGVVVIIDYGDVGEGPAAFDPVTLELSLLFHPQRPLVGNSWPSPAQARLWGDIIKYTEGCPVRSFIEECRGWAQRVAAGNREISACAYAYLVRQLKYSDTDKDLALALLDGVRTFYSST